LCKTQHAVLENCIKTTQILINSSNSLSAKGMGYAILMSIHEIHGKTELLNAVKENHDKYKAQIMCLSKASRSTDFIEDFLDPEYQKISIAAIDEFEKVNLSANYIYHKYKNSNPSAVNPESCY
jgi:hypothetical protein